MSRDQDLEIRNLVLRALRPAAQEFISKRLMTRRTYAGEIIYQEGKPFTHAVFPHEGVFSFMADNESGESVEKASVGLEGFLGFVVLLGGDEAIGTTVVQVPGYASWLSIRDLSEAMEEFECVRVIMLKYARCLIAQLLESVACNSLHTAEQRVSRWILHAHDRVREDAVTVTQQAVATALGIRRATVSEVCSQLQNVGAVENARGVLIIADRAALEQRACTCYDRVWSKSLMAEYPAG